MTKRKKEAKTLWFRAKEFGWGWYPVTWQGWLITALYTLAYALSFLFFTIWIVAANQAEEGFRTVIFGLFEFVIWMALLIYSMIRICYRTGEKPGWRWGADKKK